MSVIIGWLLITPAVWLIPAALGHTGSARASTTVSLACSFLLCVLPWWGIYFIAWRPF
jgi:hypothetical protein